MLNPASGTPSAIEDGRGENIETGDRFLIGNRVTAPLDLLRAAQAARQDPVCVVAVSCVRGCRLQNRDLMRPRQPGQDGVTDGGGIGRNPAADADVDAKPGKAGLDAFDIKRHSSPSRTPIGGGFVDLADEAAQNRPGARAQVGAGDRVKPEIEHLQSPAEKFRLSGTRST